MVKVTHRWLSYYISVWKAPLKVKEHNETCVLGKAATEQIILVHFAVCWMYVEAEKPKANDKYKREIKRGTLKKKFLSVCSVWLLCSIYLSSLAQVTNLAKNPFSKQEDRNVKKRLFFHRQKVLDYNLMPSDFFSTEKKHLSLLFLAQEVHFPNSLDWTTHHSWSTSKKNKGFFFFLTLMFFAAMSGGSMS